MKMRKTRLITFFAIIVFLIILLIIVNNTRTENQYTKEIEVQRITLSEVGKISEEVLSPNGEYKAFIFSNERPGIGVVYGDNEDIKAFYPSELTWRYYTELSWESDRVITFVLKSSPYHEVFYKLDVISEQILLSRPQQPDN